MYIKLHCITIFKTITIFHLLNISLISATNYTHLTFAITIDNSFIHCSTIYICYYYYYYLIIQYCISCPSLNSFQWPRSWGCATLPLCDDVLFGLFNFC